MGYPRRKCVAHSRQVEASRRDRRGAGSVVQEAWLGVRVRVRVRVAERGRGPRQVGCSVLCVDEAIHDANASRRRHMEASRRDML